MSSTEAVWFKIIVLIVSAVFVGFSIANIVYFNRIRKGNCEEVSEGEATTLLWLNIVMVIIAGIIFIWSLWRLIFSRETRQRVQTTLTSPDVGARMGYTRSVTVTSGAPIRQDPSAAANIVSRRTIAAETALAARS